MLRIFLLSSLLICLGGTALAQRGGRGGSVSVRGHVTKNGTYVPRHYRSGPDSSRINNWSFPGNVNPYTGKVATGDPATYLLNQSTRGTGLGSSSLPKMSVPLYPAIPWYPANPSYPAIPANPVAPAADLTMDLPEIALPVATAPVVPAFTRRTSSAFSSTGYDASTNQYWREKVRRDHGVEAPASASTYQLMDLDTQHYWVKKINRDHGLNVQPGQYSTYKLMDMDTRIYWAKKIARDHGVQFDWQTQSAYQLIDADTRMYWAKKISAKTGQSIDWRKYSTYQLMTLDSR